MYVDLAVLELTRRLIGQEPYASVPAASRFLIESVYHHEVRDALADESTAWRDYIDRMDGRALGAELGAETWILPFATHGYVAPQTAGMYLLADEAKVRTRLGDDSVRIALPAAVRNFWAGEESALDRWVDLRYEVVARARITADTKAVEEPSTIGLPSFRVGALFVSYGPWGWDHRRAAGT